MIARQRSGMTPIDPLPFQYPSNIVFICLGDLNDTVFKEGKSRFSKILSGINRKSSFQAQNCINSYLTAQSKKDSCSVLQKKVMLIHQHSIKPSLNPFSKRCQRKTTNPLLLSLNVARIQNLTQISSSGPRLYPTSARTSLVWKPLVSSHAKLKSAGT